MLIIGNCGPCNAHRFFIHDTDWNYWTGETWTKDYKQAALYADADEIAAKMHELMLALPGTLQRFVVPVVVEVKSQEPVSAEALREWMNRAIEVSIDAAHGTGPGESMVMLQLDWNVAKER